MKIRIIYTDRGFCILKPVAKAIPEGMSVEAFLESEAKKCHLEKFPFDLIDSKDLPKCPSYKWRGEKGKGIWIDESIVTPAEKRKAKEAELDAELAKDNADPVKVIRLNRELEKMKCSK